MRDRVFFFIFYFYRSLRRSRAQVQLKNIGRLKGCDTVDQVNKRESAETKFFN